MKTEILKIKGDWEEVVDDCRATVGKDELGKEPSEAFKRKILISEHSPIRDLAVRWRWLGMPHWVTVHWARHKWEKFITTQRSDRTGIERTKLPQDEPQNFRGEANAQHLIDTWRKRLCYQASPETREYAEDFKQALREVEPDLADVLVPNCVYRCGCPELKECNRWEKFVFWCIKEKVIMPHYCSIQARYDLYNEWFALQKEEK
jgi:thymidylate synthase ThyX